jgi:2-oxo-4-hydroxy-4-carboxy-5-ureidoimidazoline decarboxylase
MTLPHAVINRLDEARAAAQLETCCGSRRWVAAMLARRPFPSTPALLEAARQEWKTLTEEDHLEAFAHHPPIGADLGALRERYGARLDRSATEQAQVVGAPEPILLSLRDENRAYLERHGFVFLVCASGKSALEMLALLRARLPRSRADEIRTAAAEHEKITALRLPALTTGPGARE